uniref:LIM and SH3 domain protein F42H10.3like [Metaseiulus occidentalis] n=1 Tax=Lepeophtheirus salmonis TaxID=72036 RepID=A0A0K2UT99_LEPSM
MRKVHGSAICSGAKSPESQVIKYCGSGCTRLRRYSYPMKATEPEDYVYIPPLKMNPFVQEDQYQRHLPPPPPPPPPPQNVVVKKSREVTFDDEENTAPVYDKPSPHVYAAAKIPCTETETWNRRERVRRELKEVLFSRSLSADSNYKRPNTRPRSVTPNPQRTRCPKNNMTYHEEAENKINYAWYQMTSAQRGLNSVRECIRNAKENLRNVHEGIIALRKEKRTRCSSLNEGDSFMSREEELLPIHYEQVHHCLRCHQPVYPIEKVEPDFGDLYHRKCFRCKACDSQLNLMNFVKDKEEVYCKTHAPKLDKSFKFDIEAIPIARALVCSKMRELPRSFPPPPPPEQLDQFTEKDFKSLP